MSEVQVQEILHENREKEAGQPLPQGTVQAAPEQKADQAAVEQVKNAETNEDPDFARKFAALTKKQKELFLKERELKERGTTIEKYERLDKLKSENPYQYAKEVGLDLDALIRGAAKDGEPPSIDDKVRSLEDKISSYEKSIEEKARLEKERTEKESIDNFKKQIHDHVKGDLDRYELIIQDEAFDTVYEVIAGHFQKTQEETGTGEIMPFEKAADLVENHLVERAKKYQTTKKLGLKQEANQPTEIKKETPTIGSTLNSGITPAASAPVHRNETPEEARARIASEFNARIRSARKA